VENALKYINEYLNKLMSQKISVINAAGIFAQTFVKNIRGFNHIALGDLFNNRKSVIIQNNL